MTESVLFVIDSDPPSTGRLPHVPRDESVFTGDGCGEATCTSVEVNKCETYQDVPSANSGLNLINLYGHVSTTLVSDGTVEVTPVQDEG